MGAVQMSKPCNWKELELEFSNHIFRESISLLIGNGYKQPRPHIYHRLLTMHGRKHHKGQFLLRNVLSYRQAVLELVKCGCRHECPSASNCSYRKNNLPCLQI